MNNSRILLVEDDVEGRETMRAWLAPLFSEWTFEEVNCAEAALGIIALRKDGIEIPIELSLSAVQLEQRWHAVGIVRDITARKQTEEALGESEVRFRALLESSRDAIMILDQKGFTDCNQAALDLFGCLTRDQFIAKHPSDLSPAQQPDGQDSLTAAQEHIQTALDEGGQPSNGSTAASTVRRSQRKCCSAGWNCAAERCCRPWSATSRSASGPKKKAT